VYQILRESDNLFPFYGNFHALTKRRIKTKTKKLSQFLKVYILKTPGVIRLKFGMTDEGGHLHSKNRPVSRKQHKVTHANFAR